MSEPLSEEQLNEIEARASEASCLNVSQAGIFADSDTHLRCARETFMAASECREIVREAIPALIAEVRRLRAMESNVVTVQPGHVHVNGQCLTSQCPPNP